MPSKITLEEIESLELIDTPELQQRARQIALSKNTICYCVRCDDREVAFVALDRRQDLGLLVLYELFVPRHLRRQGIGSAVLNQVERVAIREGFLAVRLYAKALDVDISTQYLTEWYQRRGYQIDRSLPSELVKCVMRETHKGT